MIVLWDAGTGKQLRQFGAGEQKADSAKNAGDTLAELIRKQGVPQGERHAVSSHAIARLAWDPKGRRLAALTPIGEWRGKRWTTHEIAIWDARSGRKERVLTNGEKETRGEALGRAMSWSPDGKLIALGSPFSVPAWDAASGQEAFRLKISGSSLELPPFIDDLWWSADGSRLIAQFRTNRTSLAGPGSGPAPRLWVWELRSGKEVFSLSGPGANLLLSPDGRWAYTGSLVKPTGE
jgi:WD40 repeat protein